jgi:ketosteroid isomerase-like protein
MTTHSRPILLSLLFALLSLTSIGCSRTDPEKALRTAIAEMEAAVKARETAKVVAYLAEDFVRPSTGGMNKQEARRTLAAVLLTNPNIYMNVTISDVKITGDTATSKLVVVAGGGSGIIPERAQGWNFLTKWRYESGKWLVTSADWTEAL